MFVLAAGSALAAVPAREQAESVRDWYIYSDNAGSTTGVLDQDDDPFLATFNNQKTATDNAVNLTAAAVNANATSFYMNYSGAENQSNMYYLTQAHPTIGGYNRMLDERYSDANGYALGWTTQSTESGFNLMKVSVHNGEGGDGSTAAYNSNPQVASALGLNNASRDPETGVLYTPKYDEGSNTYTRDANTYRHLYQESAWYAQNKTTENDSFRGLKIYDVPGTPYAGAMGDVNNPERLALYEEAGYDVSGYEYQDQFTNLGEFGTANEGGVINGLAGTPFNPEDPDRVENQQVIRIDFANFNTTFAEATTQGLLTTEQWVGDYDANDLVNAVDQLVFYDYGNVGDSAAIALLLNIDRSRTVAAGQIYMDNDFSGTFTAGDYAFADNRVYIAQLDEVPEPATMSLLALGGFGILRRRRNRKNA